MNYFKLQESTLAEEGACLVSKWLEFIIVLSVQELEQLFKELGSFFIVQTDKVVLDSEGIILPEDFLKVYEKYISDWKEGSELINPIYKKTFQGVITQSLDAVYSIKVESSRRIIKVREPTLLLQPHRLEYSTFDRKFRSMVMSRDSFSWGLQISYPQLYQHPKTGALKKIDETFINTALFRRLQKWVRYNTQPTTFHMGGQEKVTMPFRIGKEAFLFANKHYALASRGLEVVSRGSV